MRRTERRRGLELPLRIARHSVAMPHVELIPERRSNGTVVLRAVVIRPVDRLRRFVRRLLAA